MLLGKPWLKSVKVAHDWGSNIVTIQRNGTIRTITITKHFGSEIRRLKVSLCYDYRNGITNEEEVIIFIIEPKKNSIGIINLPKIMQSMKTIDVKIMDTNVKTNILEHGFKVHNIKKKIVGNKYESKVTIEKKVYPKMYQSHQLRSVTMDETLEKIKAHEL
jgi:hypothetical protein